jgi:hypothetical protein
MTPFIDDVPAKFDMVCVCEGWGERGRDELVYHKSNNKNM